MLSFLLDDKSSLKLASLSRQGSRQQQILWQEIYGHILSMTLIHFTGSGDQQTSVYKSYDQ